MCKATLWLAVGCLGQALFTARFLVQWVASERKGRSVVPNAFWWLSLLGGMALLTYAVSRHDPVITAGQTMSVLVYVRNLMLLTRGKPQSRPGVTPALYLARDRISCEPTRGERGSDAVLLSVQAMTDPTETLSRLSI